MLLYHNTKQKDSQLANLGIITSKRDINGFEKLKNILERKR